MVMESYPRFPLSNRALFVLSIGLSLAAKAYAADFAQCEAQVRRAIRDGTVESTYGFDIVYHGALRGIDPNYRNESLALTVDGCEAACGSSPDLWDAFTIFQILTTWALPSVSLIAQLPWESLNVRKRRNLEAFLNWIGAPAASLTTTIFNIYIIKKCNELSQPESGAGMVNAMYILSCVNQYQYPGSLEDDSEDRPAPGEPFQTEKFLPRAFRALKSVCVREKSVGGSSDPEAEARSPVRRRNRALLQGIFRQLKLSRQPHLHPDEQELQRRLEELNANLAFHLRLNRRKGVWPLAFNILWFGISLVISVAMAFADLGDNTTAHSLALGLLLSWIPSLVVMAVVDRNPTNSDRCQELIERWLFNVDRVIEAQRQKARIRNAPQAPTQQNQDQQANNAEAQQEALLQRYGEEHQEPDNDGLQLWSRDVEQRMPEHRHAFDIGHFVGQGRYMRYCGVANAALTQYVRTGRNLHRLDLDDPTAFERQLTRRPYSWYIIWVCSELIVGISFGMAFMVSFNTPTIGLGCRSMLYMIWYILSSLSWLVQLVWQEPYRWLQLLMLLPNCLAVLLLFLIMVFQVLGLLNGCLCKSSVFGGEGYGGYMDFNNSVFYREAYDVKAFWGTAAAMGFTASFIVIGWAMRRWSKSSPLWRIQENGGPGAETGMSLQWIT